MSALSEKALYIAKGYIGQKEMPKSSNWGKFVQDCLATVNIFSPAYWCMSFVYRCYKEAGISLKLFNPLFKTGGCLLQLQKTPKQNIFTKPQVNDIFILDLGGGHGHTGIVCEVKGNQFRAVEGNSNMDGSANGEMVCIPRWRNNSAKYKFIRF